MKRITWFVGALIQVRWYTWASGALLDRLTQQLADEVVVGLVV